VIPQNTNKDTTKDLMKEMKPHFQLKSIVIRMVKEFKEDVQK
jgi:hypothetical protein